MRIPTLLLISALLCCGSPVLGQETLREIQWDSVGVAPVADAALLGAQPYAVYYPLLLGGGLCALLPAVLLPVILRRYRQAELQRMHALDAGAAG